MSATINSKTMATPTATPTPVIKPLLLLAVLLSLPPLVMAVTPGWVGEADAVATLVFMSALIAMAVLLVAGVSMAVLLVAGVSMAVLLEAVISMAVLLEAVVSMAVLVAIKLLDTDIEVVFLVTDEVVVFDIAARLYRADIGRIILCHTDFGILR